MNPLSEYLKAPLPLIKKECLEKPKDWVLLWEALAAKGPAILLESAGQADEVGRWVILAGNPDKEFYEKTGRSWVSGADGIRPAPMGVFEFLDEIGNTGSAGSAGKKQGDQVEGGSRAPSFSPLPFCLADAWFGIFSYEFGVSIHLKLPALSRPGNRPVPDFYFFKPKTLLAFDRRTKEIFYFGEDIPEDPDEKIPPRGAFRVDSLKALSGLENYKSMAEKVKEYITRGDIYQANIAQAFQARWEGNAGNLYRLLREMNPGPFMGVFQGRDFTVVSSSPERLVAGQGDWLETRPIAGTRPRGKDDVDDLQMRWELKTNPKEQAEHLMLVDLARNDLGKIAGFGTVEVKDFAGVESYAKVHHLVSIVQARRAAQSGVSEILKSLFPGGTITGCPKVRCMEIIGETESRPRGFYTGSLGYVAAGPSFDLNILIRSFTLFPNGLLEFCAGAGIVADSDPQKEYQETLYKVEALAQALGASLFPNP